MWVVCIAVADKQLSPKGIQIRIHTVVSTSISFRKIHKQAGRNRAKPGGSEDNWLRMFLVCVYAVFCKIVLWPKVSVPEQRKVGVPSCGLVMTDFVDFPSRKLLCRSSKVKFIKLMYLANYFDPFWPRVWDTAGIWNLMDCFVPYIPFFGFWRHLARKS